MGALTSQLIVKLIDQVSGPAKGAAASLNSITAAEKKLATSGTRGFRGWGDSFARELDRMKLSAKELDRVGRSFEQFQQRMRASGQQMRASAYVGALDAWKARTVSNIRAVRAEMERHEKASSRFFGSAKHGAGVVAGALGVGSAAHAAKSAVETAADYRREQVRQQAAGFSAEERARIGARARSLSGRYPSVGQVTIGEDLRNLTSIVGSLDHADELIEKYEKARVVLNGMGDGGKSTADLENITQSLEAGQFANNPQQFGRLMEAFVKGKTLFGSKLSGEKFLQYVQSAKSSKYGLNEKWWTEELPTLLQHEPSLGVEQSTAFSSLIGGRMTKASKASLRKFGLLDKKGELINKGQFESNPYDWAMANLAPLLRKNGMSLDSEADSKEREKAVDFITKGFSNRNAGEFLAALIGNSSVIEKNRKRQAMGTDAADLFQQEDYFTKWQAMKSQGGNYVQDFLEMGKSIVGGLDYITSGFQKLDEVLNGGSTAAKTGVIGGTLATVAGGVWGSAKLGKALWSGVFGSGGDPAAALAPASSSSWLGSALRGGGLALGPALQGATKADIIKTKEIQDFLERWRKGDVSYGFGGRRFGGNTFGGATFGGAAFGGNRFGADVEQGLDQSGKASAAGEKTGEAFQSALKGQLDAAMADINRFVQQATAALSFSATPTVKPSFGPLPSVPGKQTSISDHTRTHALFSDIPPRAFG